MQLAARLAAKKKEAADEPDATDKVALAAASQLPQEPRAEDINLGPAAENEFSDSGFRITGSRTVPRPNATGSGASRFSGLFGSDSSSSSGNDDYDSDEKDRDNGADDEVSDIVNASSSSRFQQEKYERKQQRPSTTTAKQRQPLESEDEDDEDFESGMDDGMRLGEGPFADPPDLEDYSSDDEPIEIKPAQRRRS